LDIAKVGNKFKVAVLAAKRAKQIMKTGKKKLVMEASNPLTVALAEIEQGLVTYETIKEEEREFIVSADEVAAASGESIEETENDNNEVEVEETRSEAINTKAEDEAATEEEILRKNLTTD